MPFLLSSRVYHIVGKKKMLPAGGDGEIAADTRSEMVFLVRPPFLFVLLTLSGFLLSASSWAESVATVVTQQVGAPLFLLAPYLLRLTLSFSLEMF